MPSKDDILCNGRVRFKSKRRALNAIINNVSGSGLDRWKLDAEFCSECGGYHHYEDPSRTRSSKMYWSCTRKKAYPSAEEAQFAIDRMYRKKGVRLDMYDCDYCGKMHIGHKPKEKEINPDE